MLNRAVLQEPSKYLYTDKLAKNVQGYVTECSLDIGRNNKVINVLGNIEGCEKHKIKCSHLRSDILIIPYVKYPELISGQI